jgi:hypothetical protein
LQKLFIEATKTTPEIYFSPDENIFSIKGLSSPEDVRAMYYPVIEWIKIFIDDIIEGSINTFNKENPFILKIDLEYFNSSSAKFIFDILSELNRLNLNDLKFIVEWFHEEEDTDMMDAGADIAQLAGMEFTFVSKTK